MAPLHPGLFSRRGRYLTCTQGRKCGIPRCVWDRGTRKHPGAGFAIPCFGDADDHFFFRVRCPPKKAPPGGLCKEESCPRVILDSFLIQEFGIYRGICPLYLIQHYPLPRDCHPAHGLRVRATTQPCHSHSKYMHFSCDLLHRDASRFDQHVTLIDFIHTTKIWSSLAPHMA